MRSVWIAQMENNEIRIENSWFNGEKLFINNILQDQQINAFGSTLQGEIVEANGSKKSVRVNLGGFFRVNCFLFVDNAVVAVQQIK